MPIEQAQFIGDLDETYPLQDDVVSEGDDHLRLTKTVLKTTFPGAAGEGYAKEITATEDELNYVHGVTSPIQDQLVGISGDYVAKNNGNQKINGALEVNQEIKTIVAGTVATGLSIYDDAGGFRGALVIDPSTNVMTIHQQGTGPSPDMALIIDSGRVNVSTNNGVSTTPVNPTDLTTKEYVDNRTIEGDAEVNGTLTVHEEVRIIADTQLTSDGYTVYLNDVLRASFFFDENTGAVGITQFDNTGASETELKLDNGILTINGNPVQMA